MQDLAPRQLGWRARRQFGMIHHGVIAVAWQNVEHIHAACSDFGLSRVLERMTWLEETCLDA
jgi:hypothetical protein